jgi:hypothetical protein
MVHTQPRQIVHEILSQKPFTKKKAGLVEWVKMKALISYPSTTKTNKIKKIKHRLKITKIDKT